MAAATRTTAFLGLGSNLGDSPENLRRALRLLAEAGIEVRRTSSFYRTEPVGMEGGDFVNAVAEVGAPGAPEDLLRICQEIEDRLGRTGRGLGAPRSADLDVLVWDARVSDEAALRLPHPRLHLRRFVLVPLVEIAPELEIPGLARTAADLLRDCPDRSRVEPLNG